MKILLLLITLFFSVFSIVYFYGSNIDNKLQYSLKNSFENEKLLKLNNYLHKKQGTICILFPYEDSLSTSRSDFQRINDYLKKNNIKNDEDTWTLIFSNNEEIEHYKFKRNDIDIVSEYLIKNKKGIVLPNGFQMSNCIQIDSAYFYQLLIDNRKYFVFGEKK